MRASSAAAALERDREIENQEENVKDPTKEWDNANNNYSTITTTRQPAIGATSITHIHALQQPPHAKQRFNFIYNNG